MSTSIPLATIPTSAIPDCTHVKVAVDYRKGGTNYFSGGHEQRGYALTVMAVKIEDGRMSFLLFSTPGTRVLLAPAPRLDRKKLARIAEAIRPHADTFAEALGRGDKTAIAELARASVAATL